MLRYILLRSSSYEELLSTNGCGINGSDSFKIAIWKDMNVNNRCYVTTPIYYVTAKPHLGSLYSTVLADVITRWYALKGYKTFLLTGTDEHGQKIVQAAAAAGVEPKPFVDSFIEDYKKTWQLFNINYSYFIRTTDHDHIKAVQYWLQQLIDTGDIYKSYYEGWYCIPCETFINDTEIHEQQLLGENPRCISCRRGVERLQEETYFFRLSAYRERLLQFYEQHPAFIVPKERMHEIINFVTSGLKDISISRRTITWGIPFPGDEKHVAYVWADALNNYITAIGYGKKDQEDLFNTWWPATVQLLGKDIIRFHAIYWPAFLMASNLAMPKQLLVHGWIQVDHQKMSKSLNNVVDPVLLAQQYGAESIRYYLVRYMAITQDSNFSIVDLERSLTADLAHDLGNLLHRMTSLVYKYGLTSVQDPGIWSESSLQVIDESWNVIDDVDNYMQDRSFHMATARVWKFINYVNAYFHAHEPWKLAKNDTKKFVEVLAVTCHSLRVIATLLWPVMPHKMEQLLDSIGVSLMTKENHNMIEDLKISWKGRSFMLKNINALFDTYEAKEVAANPVSKEDSITTDSKDYITIEQLTQVNLAIGTIEACSDVPKSDKLYKLLIDFGSQGKRQILAGIKAAYAVDDVVGKQVLCVINLKPRLMLGIESQGMLLMAQDENGIPRLVSPSSIVPNGTKLK